jgi:formylglycine-generating enzyme required for sulfatase activity
MNRKYWILIGVSLLALIGLVAILALPSISSPTASPSLALTPAISPSPPFTPGPTFTPVPATGSDEVPMVEVPAGEFLMGITVDQFITLSHQWSRQAAQDPVFAPFRGEVPQLTVWLDTFSIDQVEVTLGRYRTCAEADICAPVELSDYDRTVISEATQPDDYPALVGWEDALRYCQWVGKRLPTEAEWEKAARGTDGRLFPWGDEWDASRVSQGWGPVGNYLSGASPYGALDMVGNVSEWTLDFYRQYPGSAAEPLAPATARAKVIRGVRAFGWEAIVTMRDTGTTGGFSRAGVRCVQGGAPVDLAAAVVDYQLLVLTLPPPPAEVDLSGMVEVPAGTFIMGFDERQLNEEDRAEHLPETPQHTVYLDAYYIDRSPVTGAQYAEFLNALGQHRWACGGADCCADVIETPDTPLQSFHRIIYEGGHYRVIEGREDYPIDTVSWYGAQAYCAWRGKRLPTEAEWEKAARGTDGRRYPWGDEWDPRAEEDSIRYAYPVGSKPFLASPYGVMDLVGNTQGEWVSDWYAPDYYSVSPGRNPQGPDEGEYKVLRGGLGLRRAQWGITFRLPLLPSSPNGAFRCVYVTGK